MYLCIGTFLTALKECKASTTRQKKLGEAVFHAIKPEFDYGDDDSAISAVFRGKRNLHSFLQLEFDDIDPKLLSSRFAKEVVPLLDENKKGIVVRLLKALVTDERIDSETHVELVNGLKKKDFLTMEEIVFEDFLAGLFLYTLRFTDNLNKVEEVKQFKMFAEKEKNRKQEKVMFVTKYMAGPRFEDDIIRPVSVLYKQGGTLIDVVYADIFSIDNEKANIVIPVNTSFETELEGWRGNEIFPLVSENTIHGQWIKCMEKKGIKMSEIDTQIQNSLRRNNILKCGVRNTAVGKQDIYPIGSVASILVENRKYYLLALSEFDERNKAKSEVSYIENSINTIIDYYDVDGQGFDMYIPLVGTGRSRAGLSLQESYELIKEILFQRKKEIFGRVHIVIYPNQTEQVNLEEKNDL